MAHLLSRYSSPFHAVNNCSAHNPQSTITNRVTALTANAGDNGDEAIAGDNEDEAIAGDNEDEAIAIAGDNGEEAIAIAGDNGDEAIAIAGDNGDEAIADVQCAVIIRTS